MRTLTNFINLMGKKFLPSYTPPRLIELNNRWYIYFKAICDISMKMRVYRSTFNLNRIKDIEKRRERGKLIVKKLEYWLSNDRPISKFEERLVKIEDLNRPRRNSTLADTVLIDAIDFIFEIKEGSGLSYDTIRSIKSAYKHFKDYLMNRRWYNLTVGETTKMHAHAYMDHAQITRKLGNWAYNNNLTYMRNLFVELEKRGFTHKDQENPFSAVDKKKKTEKKRRNFTLKEAIVTIKRIRQVNELLFYALLLEYCCYLRPKDIRFLKGKDILINEGLVFATGAEAKNGKSSWLTIPEEFLQYFDNEMLNSIPDDYYIFGAKLNPGRQEPCSRDYMSKFHKRIIVQLHKENKLENIEGLQWYSWKDTGITDALEFGIPITNVQGQARHHSPNQTIQYNHQRRKNEPFAKGFKNKIVDVEKRLEEQPDFSYNYIYTQS